MSTNLNFTIIWNCFTLRKSPLNYYISTPPFYWLYSISICDIKTPKFLYIPQPNHPLLAVLNYLCLVGNTCEAVSMMFSLASQGLLSFDLLHLLIFQMWVLSNHHLFPFLLFLVCWVFLKKFTRPFYLNPKWINLLNQPSTSFYCFYSHSSTIESQFHWQYLPNSPSFLHDCQHSNSDWYPDHLSMIITS